MLESQTVNVKHLNLKESKERNSNNLLICHHLDKDDRRMKLGLKLDSLPCLLHLWWMSRRGKLAFTAKTE